MNFDGLIGNGGVKKMLERPFHAYIIEGPRGSGKNTLLKILTAAQLCEAKEKPCWKCSQCKKFLSGNHLDVSYIKTDIKVEDLRRALENVEYMPNEAAHRVFVFDKAEQLRVQCQNTLLKSVEEPPENGVFIFITDSVSALLPTIRSRCETLSMEPLTEAELLEYFAMPKFSRISDERKAEAAAFSGGYIGAAVDFLSDEKTELYRRCEEFANALIKKNRTGVIRAATFKKREELADFTSELALYFSVHLRSLYTGSGTGLNAGVRGLGERRLSSLCERLNKLKEQTEANVNVSLFSTLVVSESFGACWRYS